MKKLKYIGNVALEPVGRHFVIEISDQEFQLAKGGSSHISGTVVQVGKNSPYQVGYFSNMWTNPFTAMQDYGFPVFIVHE